MRKTGRISCLAVAAMLLIAFTLPAFALTSDAVPPEGREYFETDVSKLPAIYTIPNLFEFMDPSKGTNGYVTTEAEWAERRAELADIIQYYFYGYKMPAPPKEKWDTWQDGQPYLEYTTTVATNTTAGTLSVTVRDNGNVVTGNFATNIYIPKYVEETPNKAVGETNVPGPYPVIMAFGSINANQRNAALARGYAVMSLPTDNFYGSTGNTPANVYTRRGWYIDLYPFDGDVYEFNSGNLMGHAWGLSRVIDCIELGAFSDPESPNTSILPVAITTGVSRNGKSALVAAAFDERVAIAAPADAGVGGTASQRIHYAGRVNNFFAQSNNGKAPYANPENFWNPLSDTNMYNYKAQEFLNDDNQYEKVPFDAAALWALCAPRPCISWAGTDMTWVNCAGSTASYLAAKEVYNFLGSDDICLRVREGAHALQDRDFPFLLAIMDRVFHGEEGDSLTAEDSTTLYTSNPPMYPSQTVEKLSDFSSYPYEISSHIIPWSHNDKYTLYTEKEVITEGYAATIIVTSDAPQVKLIAPDGTDIQTADVINGTATFKLTKNQTKQGRYALETVGNGKDTNTAYFHCYDFTSVMRTAFTYHGAMDGGDWLGYIFGYTNKYDKEAVKFSVNGVEVSKSVNAYGGAIWMNDCSTEIRMSGANFYLPDNWPSDIPNWGTTASANRVFTTENLKFEALEGYTFINKYTLHEQTKSRTQATWPSTNPAIGPEPGFPVYPNSNSDNGIRVDTWPTRVFTDPVFAKTAPNKLAITFASAMDVNNIGLGSNVPGTMDMEWSEGNSVLTLTFERDLENNDEVILYRARTATAANSENTSNVIPYSWVDTFTLDNPVSVEIEEGTLSISFDTTVEFAGTIRINEVAFEGADFVDGKVTLDVSELSDLSKAILSISGVKLPGEYPGYIFNFAIGLK